jgi:hypothetical protein
MYKIIIFCGSVLLSFANEPYFADMSEAKVLTLKSLYCLGITESIHIDSFRKLVEEMPTFVARDRGYEFYLDINPSHLLVRKNEKNQFIYTYKSKNTYYNSTERSILKYKLNTLDLLEIRHGKIEIEYECELAEDVLKVRQ